MLIGKNFLKNNNKKRKYADECVDNSDCGNKGSCIDIMATSFPKKQCFCNPGWFGEGCNRGRHYYAINIRYH